MRRCRSTAPPKRAAEAHRIIESRENLGKVLLGPGRCR
jgi:hypothetical protein